MRNVNKIIITILAVVFLAVSFFILKGYFLGNKNSLSEVAQENQVKDYKTDELYKSITEKCNDKSLDCFQDNIKEITKNFGPVASLEILRLLQNNSLIGKTIDDHQIAHVVGRDTAAFLGINGEAFLSCPTSFNYGCQHGFFEYALIKVKPAKKAVDEICGSLGNEYSSKFKFYCYHGVGHGVMDSESYDLKASLAVCDILDQYAADGCWQGVFMENVNAGMRNEAPMDNFSKTDALAPCNQIDDKYRHECYINHAGWLMKFFKGDVNKAIDACLKAEKYVNICLQSIGLMATNPVWQPALLGGFNNSNTELLAQEVCLKFPAEYREQCIVAGVENILNFDELNTQRAQHFCDTSPVNLQNSCYRHIGISLKSQTTDMNVVFQKCADFETGFEKACLSGAGLQYE